MEFVNLFCPNDVYTCRINCVFHSSLINIVGSKDIQRERERDGESHVLPQLVLICNTSADGLVSLLTSIKLQRPFLSFSNRIIGFILVKCTLYKIEREFSSTITRGAKLPWLSFEGNLEEQRLVSFTKGYKTCSRRLHYNKSLLCFLKHRYLQPRPTTSLYLFMFYRNWSRNISGLSGEM